MSPKFQLTLILLAAMTPTNCGVGAPYGNYASDKVRAAEPAIFECAPRQLKVDCLALDQCRDQCEENDLDRHRRCYSYVLPYEVESASSCIDSAQRILNTCHEDCQFDRAACASTPDALMVCRETTEQIKQQAERTKWCEYTVNALCERDVECQRNYLTVDQCIEDLFAGTGVTCDDVDTLEQSASLENCPFQLAGSFCSANWQVTAPACFGHFTWIVGDQGLYF